MATNKDKEKVEAGGTNHEPNPNIVSTKAGKLDTTGFVRSIHSIDGTADDGEDTKWETLHIDRRFYKPEVCMEFGGVEGYVIEIEQGQADIAKNERNPQGFFDMMVLRATKPFPYCDEKGQVHKGEIGEDVIMVMTDRLKKLEILNRHPDLVMRVRIMPEEKIKILKNNRNLWRFRAEIDPKTYLRSEVGTEYKLLAQLSDGGRKKILHVLLADNPESENATHAPAQA